ncbi:hypothetical protein I3760_07G034500 [Carya illinoinensis]|nr:hypothetical protein I3760_07G034500 [Carya illinoinensis]
MYGPCGVLNSTNICMKKNGYCKNNYPKQFVPNTVIRNNCFPIYRRSNNGRTPKIRGHDLDNHWVVPYNSYLLAMFDCHINVEICSIIKAIKYLYKDIYKGHDRVAFNLVSEQSIQQIDGIERFQSVRWIAPPDAMWRIFGFIVNEVHPTFYMTFRAHENLTNKQNVIGRIVTTNHFEGEIGPLSFHHLKTVNGILAPTFHEATTMHVLLQKDNSLEECLYKASLYQMSFNLRRLFTTILVYCNPTNPRDFWERFEQDMSADFQLVGCSSSNIRTETLHFISTILESMGRDINLFHLMDQNIDFDKDEFLCREIDDELAIPIPEEDLHASTLINILSNQATAFFIDGPDGIGKTFLYKARLATIRAKQLISLATVLSSVAASILHGSRIAHSRIKISLDANKNFTYNVSKQSGLARLLQRIKLIIWDEAPMSGKESIEALDKMLKDINDSELSFGEKVIVLGGDFRNGLPPITINGHVRFPAAMLIPYENDAVSLDHLVDAVFYNISDYSTNISNMMNQAILTQKNSYVEEINTLLIHRFLGELKQYYSFDESIDASEQSIMKDFVHTLIPNGLPLHELLLKQNCPIMLLRNIHPSEGLCNGTQLICRNFDRNVIHAEIIVGHHSGKNVFIQRIPFLPNPDENSVFSHGQLYVALSRTKTIYAIKILIRRGSTNEPEKNCTKNIVYTEVLTLASFD